MTDTQKRCECCDESMDRRDYCEECAGCISEVDEGCCKCPPLDEQAEWGTY